MVDLTNARMSYAAALIGCVTYGMYFVLAAICVHFLLKRGVKTVPQIIILSYTLLMFAVTTIYFVAACAWSEVEFVEATVDIAAYDTRTNTRLSLLKDTTYIVNIWLADSLLIYRLCIIWGWFLPVIVIPGLLWVAAVVIGAILLVDTTKPAASLNGSIVINYQTTFYSLSVSLNVLCTIFIAARLWAQHRNIKRFRASGSWSYASIIAIVVESAALYSICGIIYIPLVVRMLPQQFPVTSVIGSLTAIAPNLIILRMALGTAVTASDRTATATFRLNNIRVATQSSGLTVVNSSHSAVGIASESRSVLPISDAKEIWNANLDQSLQQHSVKDINFAV